MTCDGPSSGAAAPGSDEGGALVDPTAHRDHPGERGTPSSDDWTRDAACHGRTNLFFGLAGERPERRARREVAARKVCDECPVRLPCRLRARVNHENGFWGGESEEERAAAGYPPRSIARRSVQIASR
jgi:WhiB family transcriptional regulator, redox-sensing transcriptional regulator